jgi:hypothetical protein
MERKPETLQQMFNDAQEIWHNILACEQILNEGLGVAGHEDEYELKTIDWNLEHKIDNNFGPLETLNANDFAEDYIPLIKRERTYVVSHPPHDKHEADCFIYSFVDNQEDEFANQSVEEKIDTPSFFLLDDIENVVDFPIYDEYDDHYEVDFLEYQLHVLPLKMFLFSSVVRSLSLHITIAKRKFLNQLKEILYRYAFLHLNC